MYRFSDRPIASLLTLSLFFQLPLFSCAPVPVSTAAAAETEAELEPVVLTIFTEKAQLFMEYPRLLPGVDARFLAHVTVLATGEPIRTGELELEITSASGNSIVFRAEEPTRDGLFIPVGALSAPGDYSGSIVVKSDQLEETFTLPGLVVHSDLEDARTVAHGEEVDEPADAVPFLLEQQWKIGLLMQQAERHSLTQRLQVFGEVEAPHHAMAVVSAPLTGRLVAGESGTLPHLGDRVEKGQVLALIEPPLSTTDVAQLGANTLSLESLEIELLVRELELRSKELEVEQAGLQAEAQLQFAESALTRIESLREKQLGTEAALEAARRDVAIAQRATEGSRALRASLAESLAKLEEAQARARSQQVATGSQSARRLALTAPISGEIVEAYHVEGELIEGQAPAYRVLDLANVWIAAHVSEFDLAQFGEEPGALLELAAFPDRSFDVLGDMAGRVVQVGRIVDPETRTVVLRYEAKNPDGLFRAGMVADVYLETNHTAETIAIPKEAIVMDNGRPIAFVLVHGELFQKRDLELGIRDGELAEVLNGMSEGERVVTKGAYLVKLASASPAAFGAGHAH